MMIRASEPLCDPPYRPTGGNAARNLFAFLKPQRYQSPPAWRWSNPSIASQDPIDAALVPPLKRSRDVRHTLTALPALPQLSLLFRREPCPCMPLHSHTSSSAKIRRCCVDSLNSPPKADIIWDHPRRQLLANARPCGLTGRVRGRAVQSVCLIDQSVMGITDSLPGLPLQHNPRVWSQEGKMVGRLDMTERRITQLFGLILGGIVTCTLVLNAFAF